MKLDSIEFRVRLARRGWTAAELGRRLGMSTSQISRWERGGSAVPPAQQERLAEALGGRRGLFVPWTGTPVRPVGRPRREVPR